MRAFLPAALLAIAAAPANQLTIGGEPFAQSDIVDARAIADGSGMPVIYVTLTPAAAGRLATITASRVGKPVPIAVGDTVITTPVVREAITGGNLEISGIASFDAAKTMARRISGKEPLPESDGE